MIDTGADISVVPRTFFRNLPQNRDFNLSAANGSTIKTYGTKLLTLTLGLRKQLSHTFVVADVNKAIIGADFLSKFDLMVDSKRRKIRDNSTTIEVNAIVEQFNAPSVHLAALENNVFTNILRKFPSLTQPPRYDLPVKHSVTHYIETKGILPFSRARRLDPTRLKAARQEFQHMINLGICRPSSS